MLSHPPSYNVQSQSRRPTYLPQKSTWNLDNSTCSLNIELTTIYSSPGKSRNRTTGNSSVVSGIQGSQLLERSPELTRQTAPDSKIPI